MIGGRPAAACRLSASSWTTSGGICRAGVSAWRAEQRPREAVPRASSAKNLQRTVTAVTTPKGGGVWRGWRLSPGAWLHTPVRRATMDDRPRGGERGEAFQSSPSELPPFSFSLPQLSRMTTHHPALRRTSLLLYTGRESRELSLVGCARPRTTPQRPAAQSRRQRVSSLPALGRPTNTLTPNKLGRLLPHAPHVARCRAPQFSSGSQSRLPSAHQLKKCRENMILHGGPRATSRKAWGSLVSKLGRH